MKIKFIIFLTLILGHTLSAQERKSRNNDTIFFTEVVNKRLCKCIDMANSSSKDPFKEFIKTLKKFVEIKKVQVENFTEYALTNLDKIVCLNTGTIKIRESNTIIKYAMDTANYDFVMEILYIKKDGENICNPFIDFTHEEVIDDKGTKESLLAFIQKQLADERMSERHSAIKDIKNLLEGCL